MMNRCTVSEDKLVLDMLALRNEEGYTVTRFALGVGHHVLKTSC